MIFPEYSKIRELVDETCVEINTEVADLGDSPSVDEVLICAVKLRARIQLLQQAFTLLLDSAGLRAAVVSDEQLPF